MTKFYFVDDDVLLWRFFAFSLSPIVLMRANVSADLCFSTRVRPSWALVSSVSSASWDWSNSWTEEKEFALYYGRSLSHFRSQQPLEDLQLSLLSLRVPGLWTPSLAHDCFAQTEREPGARLPLSARPRSNPQLQNNSILVDVRFKYWILKQCCRLHDNFWPITPPPPTPTPPPTPSHPVTIKVSHWFCTNNLFVRVI